MTQCLLVYSAVQPALQAQAVEALLAFGAIEFFGHFWHTSEVAPTFVEYLPAIQLLHAASPDAFLYFPATHAVHVPPSGSVELARHTQAVILVLPATDVAPAPHGVHAAGPTASLYLPATHSEELPPSSVPVEPALHVHGVLPPGE